MVRIPLIAGNWKMHKTTAEARALIAALRGVALPSGVEVVVCPPFTALAAAAEALTGSAILLGGQDVYWERQGAFTGEIAPVMLTDVGCTYVITGHSERRQFFGETDETVARKVHAAYAADLTPIVCVGERLEEREAGRTHEIVTRQTKTAIGDLSAEHLRTLVIAYEPVWAIGTGRSATGADAAEVIGLIRRLVAERDLDAAQQTRILYGGSVTPDNVDQFLSQPDIDGALVGGASLDAQKFLAIIRGAAART